MGISVGHLEKSPGWNKLLTFNSQWVVSSALHCWHQLTLVAFFNYLKSRSTPILLRYLSRTPQICFFFFLQRFYTEQLCYFHSSSLRALSAAYVADLFTLTTEYISRFYKMNTGLQRMPQILGFNSCSSLVMYMGHIKDVLITHQDWFYWRVHRKEPTQNHRQLSPHSLQSCCGGEWCGAPLQW